MTTLVRRLQQPTLPQIGRQFSGIVHDLVTEGHTQIPFRPPPGLIAKVMSGWNKFLSIPFEERIKWRLGDPEDPDLGWIPREFKEGEGNLVIPSLDGKKYDAKSFFHFRPHIFASLDDKHVNYTHHLPWLVHMYELSNYCLEQSLRTTSQIDEHLLAPDGISYCDKVRHPIAMSEHVLRLLDYHGELKSGEILSKKHEDRNFTTIQVHESHPGLHVINHRGERVDYEPIPGQVIFFPGKKARDMDPKNFYAAPHEVSVSNDLGTSHERRQSMVFFTHAYPCPDRYRHGCTMCPNPCF